MLDDDFAALDILGQRVLAYTDGTPEDQARANATATLRAELAAIAADATTGLAVADFSTAAGLTAVEAYAGRLSVATAALAALT